MGKIKGFKGFNKNLQCRDFQYEIGKDFKENGEIKACNKGFHFCENPADVFSYYPPSDNGDLNRYCEVEGSGKTDKDSEDSKVACSQIHISAEIGIKGLVNAWVKFILDKVNWDDKKESNTGYQSAATNTGDRSAATNTGDYSAATNTGNQSAATVEGKDSVAIVTGVNSKAKGSLGCWIILTERGKWNGETYPIISVQAFKVDGELIKPDTYYKLIGGKPEEVIE